MHLVYQFCIQQNMFWQEKVELIPNRYYFMIRDSPPKDIPNAFYFNIDEQLFYDPLYEDFGPMNIAKIWKFTKQMQKTLGNQKYQGKIIIHLTSTEYDKNTNAALLSSCFMMIVNKKTPEQAWKPFQKLELRPFRDAGYGDCNYQCTILDCLRGLNYATKLGWFGFDNFNLVEYEHYQLMENGDLSWIIPNKLIAFSTPFSTNVDKFGNQLFTPNDYLPIFRKLGVTAVIRLNTPTYNKKYFVQNDIDHYDLYFPDGACPPLNIVEEFLKITEGEGVFAVHCKSGLGRTGALLGCYAIKHYCFSAADFIGYIRLCRPGSVIGPQQHFLLNIEEKLKLEGKKSSSILKEVEQKIGTEQLQFQMERISVKEKKMPLLEKKASNR